MTSQPIGNWAGSYITNTHWWGPYYSPLVIGTNGDVTLAGQSLNFTYDPTSSTLSWDWQEVKGEKTKGGITFTESPSVKSFSGSINPRAVDGPVEFTGSVKSGPTPGDQLPPIPIPAGKTVNYMGLAQAAWVQSAELKDSNGNLVFSLQSTGGQPVTGQPMGGGSFQSNSFTSPYTLTLSVTGQPPPKTLWCKCEVQLDHVNYFHSYTYISEDANDSDYNDTWVQIFWTEKTG